MNIKQIVKEIEKVQDQYYDEFTTSGEVAENMSNLLDEIFKFLCGEYHNKKIQDHDGSCPTCKGLDFIECEFIIDPENTDRGFQRMYCPNCKISWREVYLFSHAEYLSYDQYQKIYIQREIEWS